jgi:hypothetical protein
VTSATILIGGTIDPDVAPALAATNIVVSSSQGATTDLGKVNVS